VREEKERAHLKREGEYTPKEIERVHLKREG
jgi:hypothetical protein